MISCIILAGCGSTAQQASSEDSTLTTAAPAEEAGSERDPETNYPTLSTDERNKVEDLLVNIPNTPGDDSVTREAQIKQLAEVGDGAIPILLDNLTNQNPELRAASAHALMSLSSRQFYLDKRVSSALANLLANEKDTSVRKACVSTVGIALLTRDDLRHQFEKTISADEDPTVRLAGIEALYGLAQTTFGDGPRYAFSFQTTQLPEAEKTKIAMQIQTAEMDVWKHMKLKLPSSDGTALEFDETALKKMPFWKRLKTGENADVNELIYLDLAEGSLKGKLIRSGLSLKEQNEIIDVIASIFRNDSNTDVSNKAKDLLLILAGRGSTNTALIALLPLLEDESAPYEDKTRILRMITPGAGKDAVNSIAKALNQYDLRNDALAALRTIGDTARPATAAVRDLSRNPLFRDNCVVTLVSMGTANDDERAHLERLLDKGEVRSANAALDLAASNSTACAPYMQRIEKLLESPDMQVRDLAARALKSMGTEAEPALASLEAASRRYPDEGGRRSKEAADEINYALQRKWDELPSYLVRGMAIGAPIVGHIVNQGNVVAPELGPKSGYIDKTGNLVIPNNNKFLRPFSEGAARLTEFKFDEKTHVESFIDEKGKTIISLPGVTAESFHEGLAVARKPDRANGLLCAYIDKNGKTVIPFKFADAGDFSNGRAAVVVANAKPRKVGRNQFASFGFIDTTGKIVIEPQFSSVEKFSEGLALVTDFDSNTYFIDTNGSRKEIPVSEGKLVKGFSEGLAVVKIRGKFGYINKEGQLVIPAVYDVAGSFKEGLAPVASSSDKGFGFINKQGETVVPFRYDWAHKFSDGLALVKKNGLFGYIDKTGAEVLKPQFITANDFENGLAPVGTGLVEILD
jgi:hypothetical protein